jgi:hypothetical protein
VRSDQFSGRASILAKPNLEHANLECKSRNRTVCLRNAHLWGHRDSMPTEANGTADKQLTMRVVSHIQKLIETEVLKAGNKIPNFALIEA